MPNCWRRRVGTQQQAQQLLYSGTIANAASCWFGMWPFEFDQPEMRALAEMNRFLAKNVAYYRNTRSEAQVALVWSDTSANFYAGSDAQLIELDRVPQRSEVGNLNAEFTGFADALIRAHFPFDVIDDTTLEKDDLSRYKAILLPNVACMSDKVAGRLAEYVRQGGGLFTSFETSLYDDTGNRRSELALSKVLGISSQNRIIGPKRWDFMKPDRHSPLLQGLGRELLPAPTYHLKVKSNGSQQLLTFTKPLTGVYDGIPVLSEDPALVEHGFGRGRAIGFFGDIGNGIASFHLGEFLRLLGNAVRELAPPQVILENAPASVELVLRSQQDGKRLLLHLINFTGEMTRPIQQVVPLENVRVTLQGVHEAKKVFTLVESGKIPEYKANGNTLQFVIPRVAEYEVVVIER